MAKMTLNANGLTSPAWAGDWLDREHVIPGGSKVLASAFSADANGYKPIPSGTVVGRTFTERETNVPFGPAADADDEVFIVAFDVTDSLKNNDVDLYRPGSIVKENFLPDYASLTTAIKAKLRAVYVTTKGVN